MKSMTGMGRAEGSVLGIPFRVEIKSINHRFCEVFVKLPTRFSSLELPLQKLIKEKFSRGKIDLYIFEEKTPELTDFEIGAFEAYHAYLKKICDHLKLKEPITLRDLITGIGSWAQKGLDFEKAWKDLKSIVEKAMRDLDKMREKEGGALKKDLVSRTRRLEGFYKKISARSVGWQKKLEEKIRQKISDRSQELEKLDPGRLHTEVLYYLDRMDVSEELERLKSHFLQVKTFFSSSEPIGRKLEFLLQEFHREFNTIASKSQNSEVAHLIVAAKAELEKIREQIQNIE